MYNSDQLGLWTTGPDCWC